MESKDEESLWTALECKRDVICTDQSIWDNITEKLDFSKEKFKHKRNTEIKKFASKNGTFYVLKDTETNAYIKMNDQEYFIYNMLDGSNSIRDISLAYIVEYNAAPFDIIACTIQNLCENNFLEEKPINILNTLEENLKKFKILYTVKKRLSSLFSIQFAMKNVTAWMNTWYHRGVYLFFTKPLLLISAGFLVVGGYCFEHVIKMHSSVITSVEGLNLFWVLIIFVLFIAGGVLHELGHGFTVVHYKREVLGFGIMLYYFVPTPFCDTTDIWMSNKKARMVVSFAGPYVSLQIGALFFVLTYVFVGSDVGILASVFSKVAVLNALGAVLGLNPLLEFDGYYMLMDYLEIPNLRGKSFKFIKKQLTTGKIKRTLTSEEKIYIIYGVLSGVYTFFFVFLVLYRYSSYLF